MRSQIRLGKIFGIQVGLHYSWLLIALLIVASLSAQFHLANRAWSQGLILAMAILTALLFFISLLLHELSHSVFARSHGIPVREITLFALGGVSQLEKEPATASVEFRMAAAGPLASAVIGLVCLLGQRFAGPASTPLHAMVSWLGYINFALAGFNLIPGYPLDGGRILRAILWWKTGDMDRATRMAAKAGQIVGLLFIALGIVRFFSGAGVGGLWIAFIGWFLLQAAGESYVRAGLERAFQGVTVSDVMTNDCPSLDGTENIEHFVHNELLRTGRRCFVILRNGEIAGLVTPHEVKEIDRARWPYTVLSDIMRPLEELHTVPPETPLKDALDIMGKEDLNQLPVVKNGRLAGILSRAQIVDYLRTRTDLKV
ncbi:MAG TPA: site-2 protease family protein [Bryobacteraceae bacterium]|nr:site-2 protease family protein [Bryobacteraceae bacterium]